MKYKHVNTTGYRVWAYTPPRVQIPNSPPSCHGNPVCNTGFFFLYANVDDIIQLG